MNLSPEEIKGFISNLETRIIPVEKALADAYWRVSTNGSEEARKELIRAGKLYNGLFANRGEFAQIEAWRERRNELESLLLRRQVEVLYTTFAGRQGGPEVLDRIEELEARVSSIYSNHRGVLRGERISNNEIRDILRFSNDEGLRREAWEASKTVGREAAVTVRELARLRNQLAQEQGHENHYLFSLSLQEIDPGELAAVMNELESATSGPFEALWAEIERSAKERFGVREVMPWHLWDTFFQEPPEDSSLDVDRYFKGRDIEALTRRTYDAMGLDIRSVLARSDLYAREGKSQHAFCIGVGREHPYDVRVLANVKDDAYWTNTMLHEFGHAIYDKHINPALPHMLRTTAHTSTTEAMALMMGSLANDPGWISFATGLSGHELAKDAERLAARSRAEILTFIRWSLVMYHFEQALYSDPGRTDLDSLWWDLVERLQFVSRSPDRSEPDWAAKIHVALSPVYYHNYVLGHLTAAQLKHRLEEISGGPFYRSDLSGRYLLENLFGPGARENWRDTAIRATGEPVGTGRFMASFGI